MSSTSPSSSKDGLVVVSLSPTVDCFLTTTRVSNCRWAKGLCTHLSFWKAKEVQSPFRVDNILLGMHCLRWDVKLCNVSFGSKVWGRIVRYGRYVILGGNGGFWDHNPNGLRSDSPPLFIHRTMGPILPQF